MMLSRMALSAILIGAAFTSSASESPLKDPVFPWLVRGMALADIPTKVARPFKLVDRCQLDETESSKGTGIREAFRLDDLDCKSVIMKDLPAQKQTFEIEFIRTREDKRIVAVFALKGSKEIPIPGFAQGQVIAEGLVSRLNSTYSEGKTTPLAHDDAGIKIEGFYSQWQTSDWNITLGFLGSKDTDNYALILTYISDPKKPFPAKK